MGMVMLHIDVTFELLSSSLESAFNRGRIIATLGANEWERGNGRIPCYGCLQNLEEPRFSQKRRGSNY